MPLKKSLIKIIKFVGIGVTILYPFAVFFALKRHVTVRALALLLLGIAGISFCRHKNIWLFIFILLLGTGLVIFNDDIFLKLYPVLMNACMCLMFALSLRGVPLIERVAKKIGYNLDESQREYTRRVTYAWAIFMFCLAVVSFVTVFLSDEVWVLFNGLISYVLIAIMIVVEFIIRKRFIDVRGGK